jgi:YidC/Oxa1 family membrane protein insertase
LYWTVNNLFSMIHQHLVNKRVAREMQAKQA